MKAALCIAVAMAAVMSVDAQQPVFRAAVDVVRVDVSVMNGITPVPNLTRDHFVITDNGVPQAIDSVSLDAVPLNLLLVLDTSASLDGDRLTSLIDAATGLVKSLRSEDTVSLMTFSDPVALAVPPTRDRAPILSALAQLKAEASTSLHDALFMSLQMRPPDAGDARPVLLLFSDGRDTSSWLNAREALEAVRRAGVVVHIVELTQDRFGRLTPNPSPFLGDVAREGGGRQWFARSPRSLRQLFGTAIDELRSRYLITYTPAGVARTGWHDVKVTLKGARGDVTARPGYFVQ